MEQLFNIRKKYTERPSKSYIEKKGLTFEKAQFELDTNELLWNRNGGLVINRDELSLTVEELDESERIIWVIEESDESNFE